MKKIFEWLAYVRDVILGWFASRQDAVMGKHNK